MFESVPVSCPACRRERLYSAPTYPCACGAPVAPRLDLRARATAVAHRAWEEEWVTVRCAACGRHDQWPRPELGCACGTLLRIPVSTGTNDGETDDGEGTTTSPPQGETTDPRPAAEDPAANLAAATAPAPLAPISASPPRPRPFRPVAIRTARDAVTATALYLDWLGYPEVRRADQRPTSGIGLAARGLLAQVDPKARPASLRDVECLWLTAMSESSECVYFSLSGFTLDAHARADSLAVPLFVMDLTGRPRPVNAVAGALDARGGG
ncbi:hypothetical protein ABZ330_07575 [Streptomyces sp. NPDC006172]|uniref:hypothetical protein n=1 Tax=Streptomyces sp. NPDC006172 TaxID=3154470 RepID=UPI0033FCEE04